MENKKTEELRKYKASIKSKLMAAIAMLLVSTILMGSTTYAWFILSTAPEVKGMATAVGSNGSLEIALLNNETDADMRLITSAVGDASVVQGVVEANETWGNIVDLSDASYGLSNITLYPSALNLTATTTDGVTTYGNTLADMGMILKTPSYGYDGRIAELAANTYAGKLEGGVFVYDTTYHGVRGIGTYTNADPVAAALLAAQSGFATGVRNAQNTASGTMLNAANSSGLTRLLVKFALDKKQSDAVEVVLTDTDMESLSNIVAGLESVANYLETAIKYAIIAEDIDTTGAESALDVNTMSLDADATDTFADEIAELADLRAAISTTKTAVAGASITDYEDALEALLDLNTMKIGGKTIPEIEALDNVTSWASNLLTGATIEVTGAASPLVMAANMIQSYASKEYSTVLDADFTMKETTIQVNQSVSEATLVATAKTVSGFSVATAEGGNARPTIQPTDTYGYIIDLAFRCSANTTLQLSAAQARVEGSADAALQGAGSNFTVTGDVDTRAMAELRGALRIVFIDPVSLEVIAVAALPETANATNANQFDLVLYNFTIDANGGIQLGLPLGQSYAEDGVTVTGTIDYSIMSLTADTAAKLSVLVYLDGNYTDTSMEGVAGMLNLQFSSSTDLTPMQYSDWVVAVDDTATEAATETTPEVTD